MRGKVAKALRRQARLMAAQMPEGLVVPMETVYNGVTYRKHRVYQGLAADPDNEGKFAPVFSEYEIPHPITMNSCLRLYYKLAKKYLKEAKHAIQVRR